MHDSTVNDRQVTRKVERVIMLLIILALLFFLALAAIFTFLP